MNNNSSGQSIKEWKCPICGGTIIGVRNYYKNQPKETVGFAVEEYCKGCGHALADIPRIYERKQRFMRRLFLE